jgi:hypothetical protein
MITAAYILIFGLLWRFMRGITYSDYGAPKPLDWITGKYPYALYMAGLHYLFLTDMWQHSVALAVALMWAVAFGWGRGFLAIHGNQRAPEVYESPKGQKWWKDRPAQWVYKKLTDGIPNPDKPSSMRLYGQLWMTSDALVRFAPLVAVGAYFTNPLLLSSLPLLAVAFGASYRLAGLLWRKDSDKAAMHFAEIASGLCVGLVAAYV